MRTTNVIRIFASGGERGTKPFDIARFHIMPKRCKINDLPVFCSFFGIPRCHTMP